MEEARYILYADDDIDDRDIMKEGFREHPEYTLLEFQDGQELLLFLKNQESVIPHICLIILDINMPILNGIQTLQQLKQQPEWKGISTVLYSTSGSPADKLAAEVLGTDILLKPTSFSGIQQAITRLLEYC
jgi:CheY-like chemotaxis protein